jgi:transcriptional regulator with PAS, ATPase and Fis domain
MMESLGSDSLEPLQIQRQSPGPMTLFSDQEHIDPAVDARGSLDPRRLETVTEHVQSRSRRPTLRFSDASVAASLGREVALWCSDKMQKVWQIIQQATNIDVTVLISGETGTGKDLVARAIHYLSSRQRAPYVAVNCAAVPKDLLESELFGHERGAFTGAHQLKVGKFESANHGTILLDEIGDLHPELQAKLLHILQDGTFSRVGGKSAMKVDVRVLAATNRDLALAVTTGRFRDDLYYRLNVIDIVVPPLRERREEIPLLAAYFMERYSKLYQRDRLELGPEMLNRLKRHQYPGNVRELENIIKRLIVLGSTHLDQTASSLQSAERQNNSAPDPGKPAAVFLKDVARKAARRAEQEEILKMLERTRWNRVRAASLLNISYRSLLYKMKDAGLDRTRPIPGFSV